MKITYPRTVEAHESHDDVESEAKDIGSIVLRTVAGYSVVGPDSLGRLQSAIAAHKASLQLEQGELALVEGGR